MVSVKRYSVYMLRCADDSFYVGVTSNIDVRVAVHQHGVDRDSYVFSRRPVSVVFTETFSHIEDAIRAEKRLKGWSHAKKEALVRGDWEEIRRLARAPSFDKLRMTGRLGDGG